MYQKILLPLDLTPKHESVFAAASEMVDPEQGRLLLLHVIESVTGFTADEQEEFYAPLRARAESMLVEWTRQLEPQCPDVSWEIRTGKRGFEVVQVAMRERCDLVIATSRAPDPERPGYGLGTTSHQVALMAPCSVLLIR